MTYDYIEAKKKERYPYVFIRLKYERKYYYCEYYDGMRISSESVPANKHKYETRHPDDDVSFPVAIAPEGRPVYVNFCGTIVSDTPIAISEEKRLMEILYERDSYEWYAKTHSYNFEKDKEENKTK
jgi:hypothetical protein